jgi:hypothetical protein
MASPASPTQPRAHFSASNYSSQAPASPTQSRAHPQIPDSLSPVNHTVNNTHTQAVFNTTIVSICPPSIRVVGSGEVESSSSNCKCITTTLAYISQAYTGSKLTFWAAWDWFLHGDTPPNGSKEDVGHTDNCENEKSTENKSASNSLSSFFELLKNTSEAKISESEAQNIARLLLSLEKTDHDAIYSELQKAGIDTTKGFTVTIPALKSAAKKVLESKQGT